jgi:vancomycin aglycone glucosyltransferase
MKIVLTSIGTRGDVQPLLALGESLVAKGHEVVVAAPADAQPLVEGVGLPYREAGRSFHEIVGTGQSKDRWGFEVLGRMARAMPYQFARLREACSGADAVVGGMMQFAGPSIAEHLEIPYFYTVFSPIWLRSDAHPPVSVPWLTAPRWVNGLLWLSVHFSWNLSLREALNRERALLRLPPVADVYRYLLESGHTLFAFDPVLAPDDVAAKDSAAGFWYLERQSRLTPEVEEFLSAGPPPVYFGFGSMPSVDPGRVTAALIEAAQRLGRRALISAGRAGLGGNALPRGVLTVGDTPHEQLFPRVACVVHHGGAGTFAMAARAGVPQVIVPHLVDQFYWGERVRALGLGPRPLHDLRFSAAQMAQAVEQALAPAVKQRADQVATHLRTAEGTAAALRTIERVIGRAAPRRAPPPSP